MIPKRRGDRLVPKDDAPIRDRKHMARVAAEPCLICSSPYVHVHHIRECYPRTTGVRVGDDKTVPLCTLHHDELHRMNNDGFWKQYKVNPVAWASVFYAQTLNQRRKP
jgi:hypothetical protein